MKKEKHESEGPKRKFLLGNVKKITIMIIMARIEEDSMGQARRWRPPTIWENLGESSLNLEVSI